MVKKRKHDDTVEAVAIPNKDDAAQEGPARTLFELKDKTEINNNYEVKDYGDSPVFRNKEKVLVTCSRRINYRYRHLMLNVVSLLPHCTKDNKIESKETKGATLNELVDLKNCSSCLFFEIQVLKKVSSLRVTLFVSRMTWITLRTPCGGSMSLYGQESRRKNKDLYLWMAKCPNGPSVKFLVSAVHTMEELKLTGNHLKGSRPILTFSANFEKDAHWKLLKEMLLQIFETPKNHRKSKPFHDQVFVFSIVDDHIWFRNYQISVPHNESDKLLQGGLDKMTLVEVGPRFCLNPIKIFGGSFGGPTLFENPFYVAPNQIRTLEKKKAGMFLKKIKAKTRRKLHEMSNSLEPDEFGEMWKD